MYWVVMILSGIGAFVLARYVVKPRVDAWRRGRRLPARFVVVDLQTTGPSPARHEILGIAAVRVTPGRADHPFIHALVRSGKPPPRKALEAARVTQQTIDAEGRRAQEALQAFIDFAGTDRLVFYDAPAQLAFLNALAERHGLRIDAPVSDARDMARRAWPARGSFKLGELARTLGAEAPRRNHPLNDCGMIATVYAEAAIALKRLD
jgi:DNA polymerase III alpha subunit (gram-positive type)